MKNLLFISYAFPPMAYVGSHRTLRFCKHLSRMGHKITVLTIEEQDDLKNDYKLLEKIDSNVTIIRTETWDPWRKYKLRQDILLQNYFGRIANKVISNVLHFINQPDHMVFWIPYAVKKGLYLLKNNAFDLLYSSSPPHSQQITGYILKKITGVKWVVDLRDPLVNNILSNGWSSYEKFVHSRLEKLIIKHADAIIVNTLYEKKEMEKRYGAQNIHVIRNSFDEEDFENQSSKKYDQFTVAHVGSYYYGNTDILIQAVKKLDERNAINPSEFRLLFVGFKDSNFQNQVESNGLGRYFVFHDFVSHEEAINIMTSSHLLLLIKSFNNHSKGHVPSKLYEYIASRNRIICIGPKNSEAAEIIRNLDVGITVGDDPESLCIALCREIELKTKIHRNGSTYKNIYEFSDMNMTKSLLSVFARVLGERPLF